MARFARKRTYRKRRTPWYRKKYSAAQLAIKAVRGVRYLKGLVNSEMLHKDTTYSTSSISGAGSVVHLTNIAQGDDYNGRTGNSILLRSLSYRYKLEINSSVTSNTTITCLIFQDTQQVADSTPSVTDVLAAATTHSLLSLSSPGRFKIISRKSYTLTPASGGRPALEYKGFHKLYSHVKYNAGASTDVQKNGLYVLFISSEATNYPTVSGTFRIGYHDN